MSATWDCQKHTRYELMGLCPDCENDEILRRECNERIQRQAKKIVSLKEEIAERRLVWVETQRLREALEYIVKTAQDPYSGKCVSLIEHCAKQALEAKVST